MTTTLLCNGDLYYFVMLVLRNFLLCEYNVKIVVDTKERLTGYLQKDYDGHVV